MRRRDFITLLGAAATSFGLAADLWGETGRVYQIGVLETIPAAQNATNLAGLLRGLRSAGMLKGRTCKSNTARPTGAPSGFQTSRPRWFACRSI
jgi:hypothetical protein